jgi:hypothetical protein
MMPDDPRDLPLPTALRLAAAHLDAAGVMLLRAREVLDVCHGTSSIEMAIRLSGSCCYQWALDLRREADHAHD